MALAMCPTAAVLVNIAAHSPFIVSGASCGLAPSWCARIDSRVPRKVLLVGDREHSHKISSTLRRKVEHFPRKPTCTLRSILETVSITQLAAQAVMEIHGHESRRRS